MVNPLRIATRKSDLAIWQAEEVQKRLAAYGVASCLIKLTTRGDEILDTPLAAIGGKGLFVKELQRAMLEGDADLAVHSMKDVPAQFPDGLHLGCILERGNPLDAFVSNRFKRIGDLPQGAIVGTCSLRRKSQLLELRPDLKVLDLRGNVNTRLKKLDDGKYDAIILATAGLQRLGFDDRIKEQIPIETMLPACAQGAIGIECKRDDPDTNQAITALHDKETASRVTCERSLNARLGGSCQTPIAAFSEIKDSKLCLRALVALADGSRVLRAKHKDDPRHAAKLGENVADMLLADGADEIIATYAGSLHE